MNDGQRGLCGRCGPLSYCRGCSDIQSLVLDMGTGTMKAGFSGDDAPRAMFPTVFGRKLGCGEFNGKNSSDRIRMGIDAKEIYVGDDALWFAETLRVSDLKRVLERGKVANFNMLERLYFHTFYNELRVTPEEHPIFVTERPWTCDEDREKKTSILFEKFHVPAYFVDVQAALALYGSGRTTGVVLDCGYGVTDVTPIFEGYPIHHASSVRDVGGRDVSEYLLKLLIKRGIDLTAYEFDYNIVVDDITKKLCYVSNFDEREEKPETFQLPDDSILDLSEGKERFEAPEQILFSNKNNQFHKMIHKSIKKCNEDLQKKLFENIVLCGGTTLIPGFVGRLRNDMIKEVSNNEKKTTIKINAPEERKFTPWIGASIISSLAPFQNRWITKDEYDDAGKTIVHRKCFGGKFGKRRRSRPELHQEISEYTKERIEFVFEKYFNGESSKGIKIVILEKNITMFLPFILIF